MQVYAGFRHEIFNEVERDGPIGDAVAWLSQRICDQREVDAPRKALLSCQ